MTTLVNIDGKLCDPAQAKISVFDRGFLYGDSVYEVLRTYRGELFRVPQHLARLQKSADRIFLDLPRAATDIAREVERTVREAGNPESYARIVCTRGAGEITLDPAAAVDPSLCIIVRPLGPLPIEWYEKGVPLALVSVRRNLRTAIDPAAKTGNYLNSVLALREARLAGAAEAMMLDVQGRVTEGSSANLFCVKNGLVRTPSLAVGILDGITRDLVLDLAKVEGVATEEAELVPEDFYAADEAFLTSTLREVLPIVRIGDKQIGDGHPGPVSRRLLAALRRFAGVEK